jgi:integrase
MASTVVDLEREMPNIRAFALQRWHDAERAVAEDCGDPKLLAAESNTFWDWALLELLVLSGLRIEEACELTTFDVLRRTQPDGRVYYLLHVKPSKFDRARVIPIGDGLGRVIGQIIRHVKAFYGKIRSRFLRLSRAAGARRSDGSELVLRPHDCRRVFASEHLNNNTPIHVIQALLGHASPDTVMVYAKLYPTTLVEEYRKTVRATQPNYI